MSSAQEPNATRPDLGALWRELGFEPLLAELATRHGAEAVKRLRAWFLEDLPSQLAKQPARSPKSATMKPTIHYLSGLDEPAWYDPAQIDCVPVLERAFPVIRQELLAVLDKHWPRYDKKNHEGWHTYFFYDVYGRQIEEHVASCPETWKVLQSIPQARNAYFSRLVPGTEITPHHGPTNASLVSHLPLIVPSGDLGLKVDGETRVWREGKCLVFDDTYLHSAWNRTPDERIVLLFGVWNPQLTALEREVIGSFGEKAMRLMQFLGKATDQGRA